VGDTKLSTSIEIEQLQNEKTHLEEESQNLDEQLKQLEIRSKILSEKIAIQELKNENSAKQQTLSELSTKIGMLETRLEKLVSGDTFNEEDTTNSNQELSTETNFPEGNTQDEDTIRVMALDNEEEVIENTEAKQQKEEQELYY
jgi:hypothetical protein